MVAGRYENLININDFLRCGIPTYRNSKQKMDIKYLCIEHWRYNF